MVARHRGRQGSQWARLKANVYARREPCCRCGQPIDYTLPYRDRVTGEVDLNSKSVDHYPHPYSTHPHLAMDPGNLQAAHLGCNIKAQANLNGATTDLGEPSEDW